MKKTKTKSKLTAKFLKILQWYFHCLETLGNAIASFCKTVTFKVTVNAWFLVNCETICVILHSDLSS